MGFSGKFKGILDTKVFKTGQYFKEGFYRVKILAVKWVDSAQGKGEFWVIETEVVKSDNDEIPVGGERSHVIDMNNVMGMPNVKAFVAAASGIDPFSTDINDQVVAYWSGMLGEHIDFEKICEMLVSKNPLEGEEMDLECVGITTQDGNPFTKHNWQPRDVSND